LGSCRVTTRNALATTTRETTKLVSESEKEKEG
jgi:hypothetical protein